jgi:hypothetical protein
MRTSSLKSPTYVRFGSKEKSPLWSNWFALASGADVAQARYSSQTGVIWGMV